MSKPLLSLCSVGKLALRDGYVGATARLFLPFYGFSGYFFASGQQYTFPTGEIVQDTKMTASGIRQANTFIKADGVCLNG